MLAKPTEEWYKLQKKKSNIADMLDGCKNRLCVSDSRDELDDLFSAAILYTVDLYRTRIKQLGEEKNEP